MMAKKKVYSERYVLELRNKIDLLHVGCDNAWACAGQRGAQVNELQAANDELRRQLQDLREVADGMEKRADAETKRADAKAKRAVELEADLDNAKDALAEKKRESRADRRVIVELARDVSALRAQIQRKESRPNRADNKKEWDDELHRAIRHGQDIR